MSRKRDWGPMWTTARLLFAVVFAGCLMDTGPDPRMTGPIDLRYLWQAWQWSDPEPDQPPEMGNYGDIYTIEGGGIPFRIGFRVCSNTDTCYVPGFSANSFSLEEDSFTHRNTVITFFDIWFPEKYPITKLTRDTLIYRSGNVYYVNNPLTRGIIVIDTGLGKRLTLWNSNFSGSIGLPQFWKAWKPVSPGENTVDLFSKNNADSVVTTSRIRFEIKSADTCFSISKYGLAFRPDSIFFNDKPLVYHRITMLTPDTLIYWDARDSTRAWNPIYYLYQSWADSGKVLVDTIGGKYEVVWP